MGASLEPDISLTMHEVVGDTRSSEEVNKRVRVECWEVLEEHHGVRKKDDRDADKVEDQVLLHCIYIAHILF
jgi:hypothetical protein